MADDLAPLLVQAARTGKDLGFRQGTVITWDPTTGANSIEVAGQIFEDLPILAVSSVALAAGDIVALYRYKSTYFIFGRIATAGSGSLQTRTARVAATDTSSRTTWGGIGTAGPSITAYVGSSRQAQVFLTSAVLAPAGDSAAMNVEVSGASNIAADLKNSAYLGSPGGTGSSPIQGTASGAVLLTAEDGLNEGLNTFTCVYQTFNGTSCTWANRRIVVVPY